jgi:predicted RNase H-like nuclease
VKFCFAFINSFHGLANSFIVSNGMRLLGIDGCSAGWVIAEAEAPGSFPKLSVVTALDILFAALSAEDVVAVDIPIGLPRCGPRRCDQEARAFLRRRSSSVFPTPCRCTLDAARRDRYHLACALNFAACGKRLSRQTHAILPKIAAVDALITPKLQQVVYEAHPEIIFANLNDRRPLMESKKTRSGQSMRIRLLRMAGGIAFDAGRLDSERMKLGRNRVARDDLVDALACLVGAQRIHKGVSHHFPVGGEELDERNLRMEIWG